MGAWGTGIFENDEALDLLGELRNSDDFAVIATLVCDVAGSPNPEYDVDLKSREALAAGEIIAAVGGLPSAELHPLAREWIDSHEVALETDVVICALIAVQRVREHLEREREYWSDPSRLNLLPEGQDFDAWVRPANDLEARLRALRFARNAHDR